jgi:hypothetical protein
MSRDNRDAQSKSTTNAFPNSAGRRGMSEEAAIFNTFMNVIKNRFTAIPESPTSDSKKKGRPRWNLEEGLPEAYDAERKLLVQINNNGMGAGLVIALGSFLFLRRGPKIFANYVSKKRAREQPMGGYQFDPPDMAVRRKPGLLFRTFKFGLDLFVATSMGMYGSAIWTDKNKLMNDLANIPLVEGKSIISEELCDDFIDVYRHIPKRTWDKYNGRSEPLDAISLFVQNCLKRHAVENQILKERKSFGSFEVNSSDSEDDDVHPSIPSPGVSPDVSIDIAFSDESQELEKEKENDEFSFEGDDSELFQFENESDDTDSPHKRF